jgi:hypothetical protein
MVRLADLLTAGLLVLACAADSSGAELPRFSDRSAVSGLDLVTYSGSEEKPHILESTGNGVLVLDYDGDGFQDLFFVGAYRLPRREDSAERSALYRNNGDGTFSDVTERAGVGARVYGHGGCVGDIDGDGLPDIYLTAYGPNLLYRNNGDGTFTDIAIQAGVDEPRWSIGATFVDADGDGDQDLFVGNYIEATWDEVLAARRTRRWRGKVEVMDGPRGLPESPNSFYSNNGDGTFREATEESGFAIGGMGYTMGVTSFDYDNDGDTDLYVANDSTANRLYRNDGGGVFEEVGTWMASSYNADGRAQGSMGVGFGDYDGDGWLDLIVTNFAHDYYTLYRNLGGELFQDYSFASGLAVSSFAPLGWAPLFLDADNDGDLDIFLANGHIYPQVDDDPSLNESYRQLNQILLNEEGRFRDISGEAGDALSVRESSRGAVIVDLEHDGDLDLAVSNQDARPTLLVNEPRAPRHWVLVDLRQRRGARQLLGSRIEAIVAGRRQIREVSSGGSYASENDGRVHFGLGAAASLDRLLVTWPGGRQTAFEDLPVDRLVVIWRPGSATASDRRE